jgi:hypothetical protein
MNWDRLAEAVLIAALLSVMAWRIADLGDRVRALECPQTVSAAARAAGEAAALDLLELSVGWGVR